MELPVKDDTDDNINLESEVLLALSRLQKEKKGCKKKRKPNEVSCKKLVEFLKANYSWLDGDIESQVMTALLSCVKTGIVCALDSGKYRLVGPNSRTMTSNCVSRISHGPKCSCLTMVKYRLKSTPRTCCHLRSTDSAGKKIKKARRKCSAKPRLPTSPRRNMKKRSVPKGKCQIISCALMAQNSFGTSKSAITLNEETTNGKCNYCLEMHSVPRSRRVCVTCFPFGEVHSVPYDKFSPREEIGSNLS